MKFLQVLSGILFLSLLTGCSGGSSTTGISPQKSGGQISIKSLQYTTRQHQQFPSARLSGKILPLVKPDEIGVKTIYARAEAISEDGIGVVIERAVPFSPGGRLRLEEVPIGSVRLIIEGRSESGTPLLSGSIVVEVLEGAVTPVESLVLFDGSGTALPGDPNIQDIRQVAVTEDSITFSWLTPEPTRSFIEYALKGEALDRNRLPASQFPATNHQVTLTGLSKDREYVARITVEDEEGNRFQSDIINFNLTATLSGDFGLSLQGGGNVVFTPEVDLNIRAPQQTKFMVVFFLPAGPVPPPGDFQPPAPITFQPSFHLTLPQPGSWLIKALFFDKNRIQIASSDLPVLFDNREFQIYDQHIGFVTLNFIEVLWVTSKPTKEAYILYKKVPDGIELRVDGFNRFNENGDSLAGAGSPPPPPAKRMAALNPISRSHYNKINLDHFLPKNSRGRTSIKGIITNTDGVPTSYPNAAVLPDLEPGAEYELKLFVEDFAGTVLTSGPHLVTTTEAAFGFNPGANQLWGMAMSTTDAQILTPGGIAISPNGTIFVSDLDLDQIQVFDSSGRWSERFGTGTLFLPGKLALGQFHGNNALFIASGSTDITVMNPQPPHEVYTNFSHNHPVFSDLGIHPGNGNLYVLGENGVASNSKLHVFDVSGASAQPIASAGSAILDSAGGIATAFVFSGQVSGTVASITLGHLDNLNSAFHEIQASGTLERNSTGLNSNGAILDLSFDSVAAPTEINYIRNGNIIGSFKGDDFATVVSTVDITTPGGIANFPHPPANLVAQALEYSPAAGQTILATKDPTNVSSGTLFQVAAGNFGYIKTIGFAPGKHPQQDMSFNSEVLFDGYNNQLFIARANFGVNVFNVNDKTLIRTLPTAYNVTGMAQKRNPDGSPGDIYLLGNDGGNCHITSFNVNSNIINNSLAFANGYENLAWAPGKLFSTNPGGNYISVRADTTLAFETSIDMPVGETPFSNPSGVAVLLGPPSDPNNYQILVADTGNHRICIFDRNYSYLRSFGTQGAGDGQMSFPKDVFAIGPAILVADSGNSRVGIFSPDGAMQGSIGSSGSGVGFFQSLLSVGGDFSPSGNRLFFVDSGQSHIQEFNF